MKDSSSTLKTCRSRGFFQIIAAALFSFTASARAGLTFEMHLYCNNQGQTYSFYTPLLTNSSAPAAALGTYIVRSPQWPTNGSQRGFDLTTNGLSDRFDLDGEYGYGDFAAVMFQITNGTWSILFTNTTTTNLYAFTVSAPNMTSNLLPVTLITFPADGSTILGTDTNFLFRGPGWPVTGQGEVYDDNGYFTFENLSAAQTNWNVDASLPAGTNFTFDLQFLTNYTTSVFAATIPTNTLNAQAVSGWDSASVLESGSSVKFFVVASREMPSSGHTLMAYYTFEDNNLFAHDFSGNNNTLSYSWFSVPPFIATNDAASGIYAGGFGGSGWWTPPDGLRALFSGSFSVSLWLKTTNTPGSDSGDQYSAAGIVSTLSGDYNNACMPMGQTGSKLAFYTGGDVLNTLHSQASINTGQYVHIVTTRDRQTGEKRIYINGALDSSIYSDTNLLNGSSTDGLSIGYNNGNVFAGRMDEIQFYSGVLSSNDVAYLHNNPGAAVADTLQLDNPAARYDFEDTNSPGADSSFHHNDANCSSSSGPTNDVASTNSAVGVYAREFFANTSICFAPGGSAFPNLSNALSGDFSVTAWVSTTNSVNDDTANAYFGSPILFAYSSATNGTVPLSITGSKAAFTISNPNGTDTTIHSLSSVNDGFYHFIAVTRSQTNGLMSLYVDGNLEATGACNIAAIQTTGTIFLGGGYFQYAGLLDDVRLYAGALSQDDITTLAANGALTFARALGTSNVTWSTSGDANWLIETTNTYNGSLAAAQSGSIIDPQISILSATVTGPGTLFFAWQNPTFNSLDLEFDIDGNYQNDIGGYTDWTQDGPYHIDPGQHILSWTVYPNGDSDPTEAAFLDEVNFAAIDTNPVSADITLDIYREQDPSFGDIFVAFPSFNSIVPAATGTTTNAVQSPSNWFNTHADAGGGGSSSAILFSLNQLLNECTNGLWTLYINKGTALERQFQFSVTAGGLTTNLLSAVKIIVPTNGATGVPSNTPFQWLGPANYSSLTVSKQKTDGAGYISVTLPANATDWPSPPTLDMGTNRFDVTYTSNNFPGFAFTAPFDGADSQTVSNWAARINLHSTAESLFVVSSAPGPVLLLNPSNSGTNFQFQFTSQSGLTHAVQYRTNLIAGTDWQTYTNVTGDGTLKIISLPLSVFGPAGQGFMRILTQ